MEEILNSALKAIGYILVTIIVGFTWSYSKESASKGNKVQILWKGFLCCAGIALLFSFSLGSPSCEEPSDDPISSSCISYADDGFEPTTEEMIAAFTFPFVLLYPAVVLGALAGGNIYKNEKDK